MGDVTDSIKEGCNTFKATLSFAKWCLEPRHIRKVADANLYAEKISAEITTLKQQNLQKVIEKTADYIPDSVNPDLDDDWFLHYVSLVERISDDDVQTLFAKLLADEIQTKGQYSVRTLNVLSNMTSNEAKTFVKMLNYSVIINGRIFIVDPKLLEQNSSNSVCFLDHLRMEECGLISMSSTGFTINTIESLAIICGDLVGIINPLPDQKSYSLNIHSTLTNSGKEIYNLLEKTNLIQHSDGVLKSFLLDFKNNNSNEISLHKITNTNEDKIEFSSENLFRQ